MEKTGLHCRTGVHSTCAANGEYPNVCGRICARLSADLAMKLSPELKEEWARGQNVLLWSRPNPPDGALPPPGWKFPEGWSMSTGTPPAWGAPTTNME